MNDQQDGDTRRVMANVKAARLARGWTQADLSERMGAAGAPTAASALSRYESGEREPRLSQIRAIATVFGLAVDDLFRPADEFKEFLVWHRLAATFDEAAAQLGAAPVAYEAARHELQLHLASPSPGRWRPGDIEARYLDGVKRSAVEVVADPHGDEGTAAILRRLADDIDDRNAGVVDGEHP